MKLGLLTALHQNRGHSFEPVESRLDLVSRHFPELRLRHRLGSQAVSDDREAGECHAIRHNAGSGW